MSWALHPLTEEQTEVQNLAREFARAEIVPHSAEWDQKAYFEPSLVKKLGELGFLGMMLPEQYDGLGTDTGTYQRTSSHLQHRVFTRTNIDLTGASARIDLAREAHLQVNGSPDVAL